MLPCVLLAACGPTEEPVVGCVDPDAATHAADADPGDAGSVDPPDRPTPVDAGPVDVPAPIDVPTPLDVPVPIDRPVPIDVPTPVDRPVPIDLGDPGSDGAAMGESAFPRNFGCTARVGARLMVRNTGTTTWTSAAGYALGAVDDSDPLSPTTRVRLPDGASVAPGASYEFTIPLEARGSAGTVTTDWRMVREGRGWFGETSRNEITVRCSTATAADFRLSDVTVVSSPDVRGFAVTSRITSLSFRPGSIRIDHERRGMWPPVVIDTTDGTTQEATIWVFFNIGGTWYATGAERLRPNQTEKALPNPSSMGNEWLYDPGRWNVMTNYVPSPGDLIGFMVVAGSTRSDNHVIVNERTGFVLVPMPRDGVETSFPPFARQE